MTLDEKILGEAKQLRDQLLDLQHTEERARVDYQHAIRRLHAKGGSLREIADELGLSHQRVHQIVGEEPHPSPTIPAGTVMPQFIGAHRRGRGSGRRPPFERFTREARRVVTLAQNEAKGLGHGWIGTEHLLLGVLGIEDGLAARALADFEIALEATRKDVQRIVGEGEPVPKRRRGPRMPFTPKAKKVLELSLRIARKQNDEHIGSEHLLLALFVEREGVASEILRERGVKEKELRRCIETLRAED